MNFNGFEQKLGIMGNSGLCMSKEEYQTGEAYRSRNSEIKLDIEEKKVEMDVVVDNKVLKSPVTDNKAQQVSD